MRPSGSYIVDYHPALDVRETTTPTIVRLLTNVIGTRGDAHSKHGRPRVPAPLR
ncbi:hypothetical protein [Burkholderia anthina]|uniref:hypothetical protein n=1 Tax=Burkholderia anthina TaxID=179879 RepID=UPI001588D62D|nr:hypothetical protein [Burkholderia anthina]